MEENCMISILHIAHKSIKIEDKIAHDRKTSNVPPK